MKLIFSPTHDHRASGMVERLIQTLKRRLATMNIDPIWDNTTIAEKITETIESIRLIPNRVTKIPPFQAHFGRPKTPNYLTSLQPLTQKPILQQYKIILLKQTTTAKPKPDAGRDMRPGHQLRNKPGHPIQTGRPDPPGAPIRRIPDVGLIRIGQRSTVTFPKGYNNSV